MDRDLRIFFLFIGLPAVLLTAAGLMTLVFGVSGLTAEMQNPGYAKQLERYEKNVKGRMATRLRAYRKGVGTNGMWVATCASLGTNLPPRAKYGLISASGGTAVGWARIDDFLLFHARYFSTSRLASQTKTALGSTAVIPAGRTRSILPRP